MADQCPFYYYDSSFWKSSYCCKLLESKEREYRMEERWANQYCRRYQYSQCPYYSNKTDISANSSGCYLTSACTQAIGLQDDCDELQTLRHFRDCFMKSLPNGEDDIQEYYKTAPLLVAKIDQCQNRIDIYREIYSNLIIPCVNMIKNNKNLDAYQLYKTYNRQLAMQYLSFE